jgi:arylsulfatase A-like enzyme
MRFWIVIIIAAVVAAGCQDVTRPSSPPPTASPTAPTVATPDDPPAPSGLEPATPVPALADAPAIDLIANRFRWHLYRPGLVIPVAAEGLRKYALEYKQQWGDVVEVDGNRGRVLVARAARLRFPAEQAGARTLVVRIHGGAAGQRVTLDVNGERVATAPIAADWQALAQPIAVRAGENEVRLSFTKKGRYGYAVVHSLEVADAAPADDAPWPALSPVSRVTLGNATHDALGGFSRLAIYLEVPASGQLVVETGADTPARLAITARPVGGASTTLLEATQAAGTWTPRRIALDAVAGAMVRLELSGDVAWASPRIALAAVPSAARPAPYRNVILVVVDALRADRLAVYNPKTRVRTPRITAEARARGVVFLHNQAASPSSPPSHASIQTGIMPRVHGVNSDDGQLVRGTPQLSTQVEAAGIAAGYYGNNTFGMARLEAPGRWTEFHHVAREGHGFDCTALIPKMLAFAEAQAKAGKRFFLSSLPYEPHVPYRFHAGITERYHSGEWDPKVGKAFSGDQLRGTPTAEQKAQIEALYDGEVEYFDACFASLLDGLAARGLADSTAVILTSDHGEGFWEHGRRGHAFGHHAELTNVPLVVFAPGLVTAGRTIETVTSQLDIAPTILDLLGVERSDRIQGQSLIPMILRDGPWVPRVMPLEYGRSYALRARDWKYIVDYGGNEMLFDLAADPTEQHDVADSNPFALRYVRDVAGFMLAHRAAWRMERWGTFDNHSAAFVGVVAPGD